MAQEISTIAVYMTYDHVQKWVYYNNVKAYEEIKAILTSDNSSISLYKDSNLLASILPNVKYVAKGAFHQWRQNDKVFALKFKTEELASEWNTTIAGMIECLRKNQGAKKQLASKAPSIEPTRSVVSEGNISTKPPPPSRRCTINTKSEFTLPVSTSNPPSSAPVVPPPRSNVPTAVPPPPTAVPPPRSNVPTAVPPPPAAVPPPRSTVPTAVPPPPTAVPPPRSNVPTAVPPPPAAVPPPPPPAAAPPSCGIPPPPPAASNAAPSNLMDAIKMAKLNKREPQAAKDEPEKPRAAPVLSMMEEMQLRMTKRKAAEKAAESSLDVPQPESAPQFENKFVVPKEVSAPPTNKFCTPKPAPVSVAPTLVAPTTNGSKNLMITREEFDKFKKDILDLIKEEFSSIKELIRNNSR